MSGTTENRSTPQPGGTCVDLPQELHVLSAERCSFPLAWRVVNDICVRAFEAFEKKPADAVATYNEINVQLSQAHAIVYRLTAFPCDDCPALVRGSNYTKVVGDKPESTQVLVVYYLLREMLKKQMQRSKEFDTSAKVIIGNYLDAYEKLSGGVNLVKCVFTYMHWVWEKLGLPTEHIILPTETIALHLWSDTVVNDIKDKLIAEVSDVVTAARVGATVDPVTIENVKRLSLNLAVLNDGRQTYYNTIVEAPYQAELASFYSKKKAFFKHKGPERYICLCLKAVEKEEFLAKCTLARLSLEKIRTQMIQILVDAEMDYLKLAAVVWLQNEDESKRQIYRASLFGLYELLGGGAKGSWMEELLRSYVAEAAKKDIINYKGVADVEAPTRFLRSIKTTYQRLRTMLLTVFGNKPPLFAALLAGLKQTVNELCDDPQMPTFDTNTVALSLVQIASEELSLGKSCSPEEANWVADIYGLLDEKDFFHMNYGKSFEIRLLKSACFSYTEAQCSDCFKREEAMLGDLFRQGNNFDFASLCHRMLKDVYITSYKCQQLIRKPIPLKPLVLTKFMWGGLTSPSAEDLSLVPAVARDAVALFDAAYKANRLGSGRLLSFLPHYSTAVVRIRASFGGIPVDEHLVVSCCQLSILLLFNRNPSLTFSEMESNLNVAAKRIEESVQPLVASRVLAMNPATHRFSLNPDYRASQSKRSILVPEFHFGSSKETSIMDSSQVRSSASQGYLSTCQSCIVKILKDVKGLSLDDIYAQVNESLARFPVSRKDIKEALDKLIEREFVGRDTDAKKFVYLP